jgi:carboxymethylenebutenolidase
MKTFSLLIVSLFFFGELAISQSIIDKLEASPRHHEWVKIPNGDRNIHAFVAYPEKPTKTQAVIVIHENRGLTDWVRLFADQLAEAGYLAIAPDLLSESVEGFAQTSDFANSDEARKALYTLDPNQVTEDLHKTLAYIKSIPSSNGQVAVAGFCWGGSQSFRFATNSSDINVAMVFYGTSPTEKEALTGIKTPVYGFYGENDQRVNATIEQTSTWMKELGKTFEPIIYPNAGHAYMRQKEESPENEGALEAWDASMKRIKKLLK